MEQNIMNMIDKLSLDPNISEEDLADFILDISFNPNVDKSENYDYISLYFYSKEKNIPVANLNKSELNKFIVEK